MVKPAPGSRKINIMGFNYLYAIEHLLFISNYHILCKFRGGQTVTMLSNGSIVHQNEQVQRRLDASSIVGESVLD